MTADRPGHLPSDVTTVSASTDTDLEDVRLRLQDWLRGRTGDAAVEVDNLRRSTGSGMSSTSVAFTTSGGAGSPGPGDYVLRLVPEASALPVFPDYDLRLQAAVMTAIGDHGRVPVPAVRWIEVDDGPFGRPFLVMDRVDGEAPADNPPYVFGGFFDGTTEAVLDGLQRESVELLAAVHETPLTAELESLTGIGPNDDAIAGLIDASQRYYDWFVESGDLRVPLIERGLDWLWTNRPENSAQRVLTWGDARIGNILYRDFHPVAALDWESATIAPAEADVAWFVFFHTMFQEMAEHFGRPGLPDFLRPRDVVAQYEAASGRTLENLPFYVTMAAVTTAIIFARIKQRTVHFGDSAAPESADEYVLHHRLLRAVLDGNHDWKV